MRAKRESERGGGEEGRREGRVSSPLQHVKQKKTLMFIIR